MINGTVNNSGVNAGTQAGVAISGGTFVQVGPAPLITGTVNNSGLNLATQVGVAISGGTFWKL